MINYNDFVVKISCIKVKPIFIIKFISKSLNMGGSKANLATWQPTAKFFVY